MSKIALKMFGRKEIRHLANVLDFGEFVYPSVSAYLGGKMGIVTLTDRRLIFLEKSIGSENLVEFALASIGAISLGKKMGGETLTISHSGTSATITTLQHGQGDAIARKFREIKDQPAAAITPAGADPIEQIERLAGLRDKGILSEESSRRRRPSSSAASRDHRARRRRCGEREPESGVGMSSAGDAPAEGRWVRSC